MEKNDLVSFTIKVLEEIDPQAEYLHNWHIELICDYIKDIYNGKIKRLIVNVPPRSLKSVCISVAFPAWIFAQDPREKVIAVSYSQALGIKHSTDCRKIMQSDWYLSAYDTRIAKGQNEKRKFVTHKNGYRFTTSVGGTLTGEGGNIIIVDDPHNPAKIHNSKERERVNNWFESVLMSRLNNKKTGKVVIVMQRLHPQDLTGYLTSKRNSKWHVLSIPAVQESDDKCYSFNGKEYTFRPRGDILHKAREDAEFVENAISELGTFVFNAQYQQNPLAASGMVKETWFPEFDEYNFQNNGEVYYSIDTAVGQGEVNDYTVILKVAVFENCVYMLDVIRSKIQYPKLKNDLIALLKHDSVAGIIIEDRNIGSSLIQDLKSQTSVSVIGVSPHKNKITRFVSILNTIESRRLLIPKQAPWKKDFLLEITSFPHVQHDDQVDALTQFLNWYSGRAKVNKTPKIRGL